MNDTKYYVHRVLAAWPDGSTFVEVVCGKDTGDPCALHPQYRPLGEFESFDDPRCAAISAVRIQQAWQRDVPDLDIELVYNGQFAGEMGVPGEHVDALHLFVWANREARNLTRCDRCSTIISWGKGYQLEWNEMEVYCSDHCVQETYQEVMRDRFDFLELE